MQHRGNKILREGELPKQYTALLQVSWGKWNNILKLIYYNCHIYCWQLNNYWKNFANQQDIFLGGMLLPHLKAPFKTYVKKSMQGCCHKMRCCNWKFLCPLAGFLCKVSCFALWVWQKSQAMWDFCHSVTLPGSSTNPVTRCFSEGNLREASSPSSLVRMQRHLSPATFRTFRSLYTIQTLWPDANGPVGQEEKGRGAVTLSLRTEGFQLKLSKVCKPASHRSLLQEVCNALLKQGLTEDPCWFMMCLKAGEESFGNALYINTIKWVWFNKIPAISREVHVCRKCFSSVVSVSRKTSVR